MTALNETKDNAERQRHAKESPLGLFISLIGEYRQAGEQARKAKFRALIQQDGYEEFLDAVIDEWMAIKYSTAERAAFPPPVADIVRRAKQRKQDAEKETQATASAKRLIGQRLLDYVMPNGKPLSQNTGAECTRVGGIFTMIGERVGVSRKVGDVLKAGDIATLARKA
jgi:hypothetical protein